MLEIFHLLCHGALDNLMETASPITILMIIAYAKRVWLLRTCANAMWKKTADEREEWKIEKKRVLGRESVSLTALSRTAACWNITFVEERGPR